jgi:hypothetical protein
MKVVEKSDNYTKGVSAKMSNDDLARFKETMKRLKSKHGTGFSLSDLLQVISAMDEKLLDTEILKFKSSMGTFDALLKKLDASDDAKARIAAILAEEAAKKA